SMRDWCCCSSATRGWPAKRRTRRGGTPCTSWPGWRRCGWRWKRRSTRSATTTSTACTCSSTCCWRSSPRRSCCWACRRRWPPGSHASQHLTFIASGVLLYWPILEATSPSSRRHLSPGAKLVYMLLATLPQDGVALTLLFSRVPFYDSYAHVPRLIDGYTALIDQTIAGAVLMVVGKVTLAVAALAVFFRWFGGEHRADRGIESRLGVR
ncbi:MAG: cytochrome c oxidase assembly protein, partial [Chloroflexi bacterium]